MLYICKNKIKHIINIMKYYLIILYNMDHTLATSSTHIITATPAPITLTGPSVTTS